MQLLPVLYSKLGDLKHADEYFDRMTKLSPEILSHFLNINAIAVCKGVYFAAKSRMGRIESVFRRTSRVFQYIPWPRNNWIEQTMLGLLRSRAELRRREFSGQEFRDCAEAG